jgi:hypothetical protein
MHGGQCAATSVLLSLAQGRRGRARTRVVRHRTGQSADALREMIPSLRPDWLRRLVQRAHVKTEHRLAKTFSYLLDGGTVSLPPRLTACYRASAASGWGSL